ncbi:MAG TPA: ABC transporter permease subunit [Ktedonobacterales bacterium]
MIWLTWRQHRAAIIAIALVVVVLGVLFVVKGREAGAAFQLLGVADCLAHPTHPNCRDIVGSFYDNYGGIVDASSWLNLLPALLGMLIGAPLVAREVEHGTHRLIWTQGISAGRWLAMKLAILFAVTIVATVILTALMSWWHSTSWNQLEGHVTPVMYDFEGIVPVAYAVFALALGIAAGVLIRRTVPAMVVAAVGFLAVRLPMEFLLRPRFQPPLTRTQDILATITPTASDPLQTAWTLNQGWADAAGHPLADATVFQACDPQTLNSKLDLIHCIHNHGWLAFTTYQPDNRFWTFQGIEAATVVALAVALLALAIWRLRKRIA